MGIKPSIIILFLLIIFLGFNSFQTSLFDVTGKAIMLGGIQNPIYGEGSKIMPISGTKILAAKGKVLVKPRKQSIPINQIKSSKIFSLTNDKGIFKFKLPKGEYTFFIIIDDHAYLNSFDGKGNFSSKIIESNVNNIVLTDKRGVLH